MADINISFSTNARQDARLAQILAYENDSRAAIGLGPFADVTDMLRTWIIDKARASITTIEAREAVNVQSEYVDASEAVQAQVRSLLGIV